MIWYDVLCYGVVGHGMAWFVLLWYSLVLITNHLHLDFQYERSFIRMV